MHVFLWVVVESSSVVCSRARYAYVTGAETVTAVSAMIASLCLSCIGLQNFTTSDTLQPEQEAASIYTCDRNHVLLVC